MSSDDIHVLGLSPREQYLIKLVLGNLFAGYLEKTITESPGLKTQTDVDSKTHQALNFFKRYNNFSELLCPEGMLGRARSKVLMVQPEMMRYLVTAFNGYDHHNNYLSPQQRAMTFSSFDALKKKIVDSSKYTYSKTEIEKARGG